MEIATVVLYTNSVHNLKNESLEQKEKKKKNI